MEQVIKNFDVKLDSKYLILTINNQVFKFKFADISDKLSNATNNEKIIFKISPSGYGIHWPLLDEDLSIKGLLKTYKAQHSFENSK